MKTLGKVAGGIGLLLVLTSPGTAVAGGSATPFIVTVALGVALCLVYAATNRDGLSSALARSALFHGSSLAVGLLTVAALGAANFIVAKRGKTWDLTRNKIYSLAPQTKQALSDLKEPVKAIVFTQAGGAPPAIEALFRRYAEENDKFGWDFKDVNKSPDLVKKYDIRPGQLAVLSRGESGAEKHVTLNVQRLVHPQEQEQELTNGLLKLAGRGQQKLYFVVGHGEPLLQAPPGTDPREVLAATMTQVKAELDEEGYVPTELNVAERNEIPPDAAALVVTQPRGAFSDGERALIEKFLAQGGRLLYFAPTTDSPALAELLQKYGVNIEPGLVADARGSPNNPYVVVTPFMGDHELVKPLSAARANLVFIATRGLTQVREGTLDGVTVSPLVLSSPNAWVDLTPSENPQLDSGERAGQTPLAFVVTRSTAGAPDKRFEEARVLVFGSGALLTAGFAASEGNRNLVLNAFAWAAQHDKGIAIRPPDRDLSSLDVKPEMLGGLRLITMYVLPVLLLAVGLTIWQTRRAR